jgi:hypothetical protein
MEKPKLEDDGDFNEDSFIYSSNFSSAARIDRELFFEGLGRLVFLRSIFGGCA